MTTFRLNLVRGAGLVLLLVCTATPFAQPAAVVVLAAGAEPFGDIQWFLFAAIGLCILLPLVPLGAYLHTGWFARCNDITASVAAEAKKRYLQLYSMAGQHRRAPAGRGDQRFPINRRARTVVKGTATGQEDGQDTVFDDFYTRWYGRRRYVFPILLFAGVLGFVAWMIGFSVASLFPYWETGNPSWRYSLNPTALSAIAGAYLWVTSDFIRRSRRLDLAPSDISWGTLRLVIAVPMGYAFAGFGAADVAGTLRGPANVLASVIAFSLGALPLAAIQDILRQSVYKRFTTTVPKEDRADAVTQLQGIDDEVAMRLESEGITTIPQLATCDPVRLAMRSNLQFSFVTDYMSQAVCWEYFGEQLVALRPLGLRGAVDICTLLIALESTDEHVRSDAQATLQDVVAALQPPHTIATLRYTLTQIARNPVTRFLASAAGQTFESRAPSPRAEPQAGPDTGWDGLAGDRYSPGPVH
jgi:hypothetical protein